MCGRFSISTPIEEIRQRFKAELNGEFFPRYNAAPGDNLPIIPEEEPDKIFFYRWGLIPHWATDPKIGSRMINARAETISEKPSFRTAFKKHRCLVIADGFYEWDKKSKKHVPYRVTLLDGQLFAMAGICSRWEKEGKAIDSFSIITTSANGLISTIHDRMPVILKKEEEKIWLDPLTSDEKAKEILAPYPAKLMISYPVSTLVNNPRNDRPEVTMKI